MKSYFFALLIFVSSCETQIKHPTGGFDYPQKFQESDTNFYYYPLKDIESKREAFRDSYYYLYYRPYNELNLSIKPQPKDTYRLTYSTAFGNNTIITFTEDSLIVKSGDPTTLYDEDTTRLTNLENFHLSILRWNYPLDSWAKNPKKQHLMDSIVGQYPILKNPLYYHKLYQKTIVRNDKKFVYSRSKIILTKHEYNSLVRQIDESGFWTLPFKIECEFPPTDGYGFSLEANTQNKYKIVRSTGCPDDKTKFTKACQQLIDLAKLDKKIQLIWNGTMKTVD